MTRPRSSSSRIRARLTDDAIERGARVDKQLSAEPGLTIGKMAMVWEASQSRAVVAAPRDEILLWADFKSAALAKRWFVAAMEEHFFAPDGDRFRIVGNDKKIAVRRSLSVRNSETSKKRWKDGDETSRQPKRDTSRKRRDASRIKSDASRIENDALRTENHALCIENDALRIPENDGRCPLLISEFSDQSVNSESNSVLTEQEDAFSLASLNAENGSLATSQRARARKPTAEKKPAELTPTTQTWRAYAAAYEKRYRQAAIANSRNMGLCKHLVARLGADLAPEVLAFYVGHGDSQYVRALHPLNLALRDAEKLATEYRAGAQMTAAIAAQSDRATTNDQAAAAFLASLPKEGAS